MANRTTARQSPEQQFPGGQDPSHIVRSTPRPDRGEWRPEFRPLWDSGQGSPEDAEAQTLRPLVDRPFGPGERILQPGLILPCARPDRPRSKSLRGRRGCIDYKVAFRKCGRRPLQRYRYEWRSSYQPPVRAHRHYRQIASVKPIEKWSPVSAGQNEIAVGLAVVALLLLLGLLCCVVLVIFLWRRPGFSAAGFSGCDVALEFANARLDFVNDPDILVIVHDVGLRGVIRVPYCRWPQAYLPQISRSNPGYGQHH